jgi:hypothetical protein
MMNSLASYAKTAAETLRLPKPAFFWEVSKLVLNDNQHYRYLSNIAHNVPEADLNEAAGAADASRGTTPTLWAV